MGQVLSVLRVFSLIVVLFSATMLVPGAVSWWLADGAQLAYDEGMLVTLATGLVLWFATRRQVRELHVKDGFLLVVMAWTLLPAFSTIPLLLYFGPSLSFTDAYFEAMSGLTATGATVLTGLERLPASINLWRALMHWLGGLGIIVLAVAILPLLGVGGRQMFKAETPGPMKDARLTPRMAETAKGLWTVYVLLTLACMLAFTLAGMSWLDAFIHAFSVLGLGGFSAYDASLGYFNDLAIEIIAIVFALAAGMNFATHFLALRHRRPSLYLRDPEIPYFFMVLVASCFAIALYLWVHGVYPDFYQALRYATFNTVSVATSLGFATTDYALWPMFAPLWMLFLGSFLACSGSCGGGIKMVRALILYKQVFREILRSIHPASVRHVTLGNTPLSPQLLFAVLGFSFVYMASVVFLTLLLAATGLDALTAFSAVIACINNTGPGLGAVGPASNFSVLSDFQTWVCIFAMLLGRLELFTLLVVFTRSYWRR
jgi:trk system potassium uptake protein TrkH